jgi:hypothetical protein
MMMVKEEIKKVLKKNTKFPPWEDINYWLQIEEYFFIVKKLHNGGLNPKTNLTSAYVCENDLVEVFGLKCILKLTNTLIHANTKHDLKKLH